MSQLHTTLQELLADPGTIKVIATADEQGHPHLAAKGSLRLDEQGNLIHLELIERSRTNRNLLFSLWQDKPVSILLVGSDRRSLRIHGLPRQVHVSGPVFQQHYEAVRAKLGDVDLAGVWVIRIDRIEDATYKNRLAEEEGKGGALVHLDRLVRDEQAG